MRKTLSTLITIVLALLSLGIVMLASSSSVKGSTELHDPLFFFKRQVIWLFMSIVVAAIVVRFDYHWWQKFALPLAVTAVILLVLVFIPPFGHKAGGSNRWLRLGPFSLQPSEVGKFAVVVVLSSWMTFIGRRSTNFKEGLLYPVTGLGIVLGLLLLGLRRRRP